MIVISYTIVMSYTIVLSHRYGISVSLQNLFLNLLLMTYFKLTFKMCIQNKPGWGLDGRGWGHLMYYYICHANCKELT